MGDDVPAQSSGERNSTRTGTPAQGLEGAVDPVLSRHDAAWLAADAGSSVDVVPETVTVVRNSVDDIQDRQMIVWLDGERIARPCSVSA